MSDHIKTQERLRAAAVACEGWSWPDRMRDENGTHHFGKRRDGEFHEIGTIDASTYTGEYVDDIRVLKFIRAAQPEAILRLLDEVAELRAALAATQAELDEWRFTNRVDESERALVAANTALAAADRKNLELTRVNSEQRLQEQRFEVALERAKSATTPIVAQPVVAAPHGWQWVPKEPTGQMVIDGFESAPDRMFDGADYPEEYDAMSGCQQAAFRTKRCWAAMLAAAPAAPTDGEA